MHDFSFMFTPLILLNIDIPEKRMEICKKNKTNFKAHKKRSHVLLSLGGGGGVFFMYSLKKTPISPKTCSMIIVENH